MKTLPLRPLAQLLICIIVLYSCKKDHPNQDNTPPFSFSFDQQTYSSGQLVVLKANQPIEQQSYSGSFGDSAVNLMRSSNDSALVFVMPFIADGTYQLIISELVPAHNLEAEILNIQISDPQSVISSFSSVTQNHITHLENKLQAGADIDARDIQALEDMQAGANELIGRLSVSEKQQLAMFIKANSLDQIDLNSLAISDSFLLKSTTTTEYPSIQWSNMGAKLIVNGTAAITTGYVFANLVAFPDPSFLTKAAAAVAGVALCAQFIDILSDIQKMAQFTGIPEQVNGWFRKSQNILFLTPNVPDTLGIKLDFRVLNQQDTSSSFSSIKDVALLIIDINQRWVSFKNQVEIIKSWFTGASPQLHSAVVDLSANTGMQSLEAHPGFFTLDSITNNVALSHQITPNGIEVEISSSIVNGFSFDVVYHNPGMGNPIRKTINVQVEASCGSTFTDPRDEQTYNIIQIGNQCWFAENLRYSSAHFPQVSGNWSQGQIGWCYYDNTVANNAMFGKLYNWYAVSTDSLCPDGWHIPSDAEWTELTSFLGGQSVAGGKMKSTTGWNPPNAYATNASGFSAVGGGLRAYDGSFLEGGSSGVWWSSTGNFSGEALTRVLLFDEGAVYKPWNKKETGASCRCVKD